MPELKEWNGVVASRSLCGIMNSPSHVRWKLGSIPNHSIIRSHLMYCDEVLDILRENQFKTIFIYRDLRDVAISLVRWASKTPMIFLYDVYLKMPTFDEQLMSSIEGISLGNPFGSNISQPDIGQDFLRWKGWIDDPTILAIRFEDLVGERGGGSEEIRLSLIEKIAEHLEVKLSSEQIKAKFSSNVMNPEGSPTFGKGGKGGIGDWKTVFNQEHKEAFKKVAGDLLIELGYEKDLNW
jgi:hypothetical protein